MRRKLTRAQQKLLERIIANDVGAWPGIFVVNYYTPLAKLKQLKLVRSTSINGHYYVPTKLGREVAERGGYLEAK